MLTPEGRIKAQAEYDEQRAALDAKIEGCRYCKAAKTKKAKNEAKFGKELPGLRTECQEHRSQMRNLWACSPLSETYWAS